MTLRQSDIPAEPTARPVAAGRAPAPGTVTFEQACPAHTVCTLPAHTVAVQLPRSTGGHLVRAGNTLLQMQRLHGNRHMQQVAATTVQRDADERAAGEQVRSVLRVRGTPLEPAFRARAEAFLRADLSHVRVHTDEAAARSARSMQAQAYTSGSDIVFDRNKYDTTSMGGQARLVHELIHVVQQQHGPVAGTTTEGGLVVSDPADRFEREAEQAVSAFVSGRGARAETSRAARS